MPWDRSPFFIPPDEPYIGISRFELPALLILLACLVFLRRQGKSIGYLLCFCLFCCYLWEVAHYTIFPFPIRINPHPYDALLHRRVAWIPSFIRGDFDLYSEQTYGNFLLGVPFGVALPFIMNSTPKRIVWLGLGFAVAPELIQYFQGIFFYGYPHFVDIDDVWLAFLGVLCGYALLRAAAYVYQCLGWTGGARTPVWNHFHAVLLGLAASSVST